MRARRKRGFTLIELMITLAVIAALAGIAYASYQRNVMEARRKAATGCILEISQFMERYYTTQLTYVGATSPPVSCRTELAPFYTIAISGTPTATAYTVTAVPRGQQLARDTVCGTLGITQTGAKSESGTGTPAECW